MAGSIGKKQIGDENSDRISDLPDSLLINILSLLNAKDVAQTCILSKSWRNIWAFVPILCFDFAKFRGEAERFNNFVSSFLCYRDDATNVQTFTLIYNVLPDVKISDLVNTWIMYALDHKVKKLEVDLFGKLCMCVPNWLFTSDSLVYLHLKGYDKIEPDIVCLPKLRSMSLCDVSMPNDSMQKVLSGCPALETLSIRQCVIMMMDGISFPTVKSLSIIHCDFRSLSGSSTFTISAPCLKYIYFHKCQGSSITFKNMSELTVAKLIRPMDDKKDNGCDLLSGILGIKTLILGSLHLKEFLTGQFQKYRKLQKLKFLCLGICCSHSDVGTFSNFLKHCPNLEFLRLVYTEEFCRVFQSFIYSFRGNQVDHGGEVKPENFEEIECSSCRNLKLIEIVWFHSHLTGQHLKQLVLHWTKKINGVQINGLELKFEPIRSP